MNLNQLDRRTFLAASASAALGASSAVSLGEELHGTIRKAMIVKQPTEAALAPLKEAGFQGVEAQTYHITEAEATHLRDVAAGMNMRIHSVMRGWASFNSDDTKIRDGSIEDTRQAMRAAHWYGADDILLVPCRVGGKMANGKDLMIPAPWDFDIEFDEKTLHVTRVVAGDNSRYQDYIDAQNKATDMSRKAVESLIPLAEELKVIIALENVWNNLWVQPRLYKAFVASFNHPYVKSYFDIGNHVKYRKTPVHEWIPILGNLIVRLHIKDYLLGEVSPVENGDKMPANDKWKHPLEGSINWPAVRKALSDVNFDGWASIEDGGLPLKEFNRRFDLIIAGKQL